MTEFDLNDFDAPVKITAEVILNQIDDLLIYRHYLGDFTLGNKVKNPFRKDSHPSFSIFFGTKSLKLMWKDFATGMSGDCFGLVSRMFNLNYYQSVEKVATDFGLIKGQSTVTKRQIAEAREFKEQFQKREYLIQVERRSMNEDELNYWLQYNITKQDCLDNQIFAINKLWINKRLMHLNNTLHFAYYFPNTDKWKIYSPYDKERKWFGNVSCAEMENISSIDTFDVNKPVIITKSRKDRLILSKLYSNTCSSQNESEGAIPKEMDEVFNKFPSKFCWFDSDEPGKNANRKLNHRGYKWINIPNEFYENLALKDPGDVIKYFGWEKGSEILKTELKKKGIL